MELSVLIFFLALLIPGFWLIFTIGREYRRREGFNQQWRIEQERAAYLAVLRRAPLRSAALPSPPMVEPSAPGSSSAQGDSWQDLTASNLVIAFESFQSAIPQPPSEQFLIPQIDEAFEKFMGEMRQREQSWNEAERINRR
jgi:hypothetical protein